ncbi:receptor-type tyrosine-protein phosphatase S-like isoform X3 [Tachypleus tridentatus]|uniref:receptor-type tyrosine-protein phosphatase S-like isoform X3 n=1 Tax=Tachypleus tridentatus TaxID=6853 RepID=UPI003FD53A3A
MLQSVQLFSLCLCFVLFPTFISGQFDANFTLRNVWGRLPFEPSRSLIQCTSSSGQPEKIKFSRTIDVGEGLKLPKYSQQFLQGAPVYSRILFMPSGDALSRFGAYDCEVTSGGVTTKITTLKLPPERIAEFEPEETYLVVNQGEEVHLIMKEMKPFNLSIRWRFNGGDIIEKWNDQLKITIPAASLADAGIYECYYEGRRNEFLHGILRLIVRACGGNRFGADCTKICSQVADVDSGCAIHLFCKPDPYGCSCAPGYKGPKCAIECKPGWYGADCKQPCHCASGSKACNRITGECNGGCDHGWIGESCQIRDPSVPFLPNNTNISCPVGKFGKTCDQKCHCKDGVTCDSLTGTCPGKCENGWSGTSCDECVEGQFGENCENTCHCEGGHINCDKNGFCIQGCVAGWTGFTCQQKCNQGWFGQNCAYSCHCKEGVKVCDVITGNCEGDCEAGYMGENCQTFCPNTHYGVNCNKSCACKNGGYCNRIDGSCVCEGQWKGSTCTEKSPQIVAAPNEEVNTGQPKSISCTAEAIPPPSIQITSSKVRDINSKIHKLAKNQYKAVTTVTATEAGNVEFFCIARNGHGFTKTSFTLHVIDPPVLRERPKILGVNSTSVTVGWHPWEYEKDEGGKKSDRVNYMVVYHEKKDIQWQETDIWQSGLSSTIPNLLPDTEYEVAIRCQRVGHGGEGKPGPSFSIHTLCGKPTSKGIPHDFLAVAVNATSIQLTWKHPMLSELQCRLLAYRLRFWKTLDNVSMQHAEIASSVERYVITDLAASTNYTFQLYPLTSIGLGFYYASVNITTPEAVPGPVQNLMYHHLFNPHNLLLTWDAPFENTGSLKIYSVKYGVTNIKSCGNSSLEATDPGVFTALITKEKQITLRGLLPYSKYYITVSASTSAGFGDIQELYADTKEAVPTGVPQNVHAITVGKTVLEFHWDSIQCDKSNGKIISYEYALQHVTHFRINKTRKKRKALNGKWAVPVTKTNGTTVLLTGLIPFQSYAFIVRGCTISGPGPFSKKILEKTAEDVPPAPSLSIMAKSNQDITLKLIPPNPSHGVILQYTLAYWLAENKSFDTNFILINNTDKKDDESDSGSIKTYLLQKLLPYTQYSMKARCSSRLGWGEWSKVVTVSTEESLPGPPTFIHLLSRTNNSLKIGWSPPDNPNGVIVLYHVKYQSLSTADPLYEVKGSLAGSSNVSFTTRSFDLTGLHHSTEYRFQIWAVTQVGFGKKAEAVYWTEFDEMDAPPNPIVLKEHVTDSTVSIEFTPSDHTGVRKYQIIVEAAHNTAGVDEIKLMGYKGSVENNIPYYITAELDAFEVSKHAKYNFIVGDGKTYGGFTNVALKTGERYNIRIRTIVQFEMEEKSRSAISFPESSIEVGRTEVLENHPQILGVSMLHFIFIILGVFVVLTILLLFLGLFFSKRNRKSAQCQETTNGFTNPGISDTGTWSVAYKVSEGEASDSPVVETSQAIILRKGNGPFAKHDRRKFLHSPTSVRVQKLPDYIFNKNIRVTSGFSDEFHSLLEGQTSQWTEAKKAENIKKNRYGNLLPYDHSRVILEPLPGVSSSDYINASYIDGYNRMKEYIATQGPKENTFLDFWRMVWQENSSVIVMVTGLVENGKRKCAKYWPEDSIQYGDLQVLLIHTETCMDFIIRTFLLRKERETRRIHHYQFLDWPDQRVPANASSLLMLHRRIQTDNPENKNPVIVHCSAGVGRSGTFIAIDALRSQADREGRVDVFSFVNKMRMQRINMVPTLEQYIFIYEAISDAFLCGNTVVMADQLHTYLQHIFFPQLSTQMSELEQQFETLSKIQRKTSMSQCSDALNDINILKNRDPTIVPSNRARIQLLTPVAESKSDYINAITVDGYKCKNAFIVTQMPLKQTVVDFWRLIYDMQSSVIVMLNDLSRIENTMNIGQYWPSEGCATYGPFEVQIVAFEDHGTLIVRIMKLINLNQPDDNPQKVIQLQYMDWDQEEVLPTSTTSVLALLNQVERWYRRTSGGPIAIHCMNGASRCGLFCATSCICDQIKTEHLMDIFQVVKWIRNNRPEFIYCLEQYKFCYEVALELVDSFSVCGNLQRST